MPQQGIVIPSCSCHCQLHGNLSPVALEAWRSLPYNAGRRFDALAGTLREAPPVEPSCLARLLHCVAERDAEGAGAAPRMPAPDAAFAAALSALPEVPIPVAAALHIAKSSDGYMSAAVQSTFWSAFVHALRGLHSPNPAAGITAERAWKRFLLVPRLLLTRTRETGPAGRTALLQRLQAFEAGRGCELLDAAMPSTAQPQRSPGSDVERMRERACAQVRRGELSRARQTLTGAPLAPSNADMLRLLSDPDKRPPHPRHPIPDDVVRFRAANPLRLKAAELGEALRTAKRGSAAGLSGASVEHYRLLLEDEEALDLLAHAASLLANADAPADVLRALALSRLTALSKPGGASEGS